MSLPNVTHVHAAGAILELKRRGKDVNVINTEVNRERNECENNFYYFVRKAWEHVEPNQYIDGWHVKFICDHIQAFHFGKIDNLLINIPPNFAKSLLCAVFYPAWVWTFDPKHSFLTGSRTGELCVRDCRRARVLMTSSWYQRKWGGKWRFARDENLKGSYANNKQGYRVTFSSCGSVTGLRAQTRIFDDPHDASESKKADALKGVCEWYDSVFSTRGNIVAKTRTLIIMQRLAMDDLAGHLLAKKQNNWTHLCLPMEFDPDRRCATSVGADQRIFAGELLWDKITPERLAHIKQDLGAFGVSGQLQQKPIVSGGTLIKTAFFARYKELPILKYRCIYGDTAQKTKERNDFSVFSLWGLGEDGRLYLLDLVRGKWEAPELERRAVDFWNKHREKTHALGVLRTFGIEDKASGTGLIQVIKQRYAIPVKAIERVKDKYTRCLDVIGYIEAGKVAIPIDAGFVNDFMEECERFQGDDGTHDDQVDTLIDAIADILQNTEVEWSWTTII